MAKKAVATLHEGNMDGRAYTKVIKMVKSPKTGAYVFDEKMVPNEAVKDFFKETSVLLETRINTRRSQYSYQRVCGLFCFCYRSSFFRMNIYFFLFSFDISK